MTHKAIVGLFLINSLAACQNSPSKNGGVKKSVKPIVAKNATSLESVKKTRDQENVIQDLKDENRIVAALKKRNLDHSSNDKSLRNSSTNFNLNSPLNEGMRYPITSSKSLKTDLDVYKDLQNQFNLNNEIAFFARAHEFKKRFARSHLMDDVIYLSGLMSLSNKNYASSIKYFNQVIKEYPTSQKAAAAVFAKGISYKRMNLLPEAQQIFKEVQQKYPGSVEALRATNELKVLPK